ncbi:MAG: adenosylcobinamide-GDP ribazoletransferase [Alphaproteobacteria bacterium]|nr:adenosylcobinamide-GDP ribazoletransferase [Alphaproteobacteria bacterium]MCB9931775.1 adenosylcobinamide-GDP ribazoletransferase [Alphaproteobacteria bacterium]
MKGRRGFLACRCDELRLAFMLLSRLPMGRVAAAPPLAQSFWAYPLVGAVIGGAAGLVLWGALAVGLPPLAAATVALGVSLLLTGAMHEDGLADTADGFGGGDSVARTLEIMRDSRLGSYGVLALITVCGLRIGLWAELGAGIDSVMILALIGALSRAILPPMMLCVPMARTDGLGYKAVDGDGAGGAVLGGVATAAICATVLENGIVIVSAAIGAACFIGIVAKRKISGLSGDVLGTIQVVAENVSLIGVFIFSQ